MFNYLQSGKKFILRVDCPFSIPSINFDLSSVEDQTGWRDQLQSQSAGCRWQQLLPQAGQGASFVEWFL